MKKFMVLAIMFVVAMTVTPVLAQSTSGALDLAKVAADAAAGPVAISRVEELRIQLTQAQAFLTKSRADINIAHRIGSTALARAEKVEEALAAKVTELEGKLASEATKANAEVDKAAVEATVKIVGIQHGVPAPPPPVDAVAQVTNPAATSATTLASTGLERTECPAGTALSRLRISVTDGALRTGFRNEEKCLPIPGYVSPTAAQVEKPRTMPLWLKYASFIASGAAIGGAGTYAVNRFGDGAGGAGDVAGGAVLGAVGGTAFCALTELF